MVWYGVEIVRLLQWYNSNSTLSCLADNALWGYCSRRPTHPKFDSGIGWSDSRVLGIKKFASMYIYGMFSLKLFFLAGKITNANRWFRTSFLCTYLDLTFCRFFKACERAGLG